MEELGCFKKGNSTVRFAIAFHHQAVTRFVLLNIQFLLNIYCLLDGTEAIKALGSLCVEFAKSRPPSVKVAGTLMVQLCKIREAKTIDVLKHSESVGAVPKCGSPLLDLFWSKAAVASDDDQLDLICLFTRWI